jgi:hypothetical protein
MVPAPLRVVLLMPYCSVTEILRVEGATGDAELAGSLGLGEPGHGVSL